MDHPVKVSADVFASLQQEVEHEGLTLQAALQRRLDEGDRTVRELAEERVRLEHQLATLHARLGTAGKESAQDKQRRSQLEKEQARLTDALKAAAAERDELADALHEARGESAKLSSQLATVNKERDRSRKTRSVIIGTLVVGSLIAAGCLWLRRSRANKRQAMDRKGAAMSPYQPPVF